MSESLPTLKETILSRDGKTVLRPDSGDPVEVICGKEIHRFSTLQKAESWCRDDIRNELSFDDDAVEDSPCRHVYVEDEGKYYKIQYWVHFNRRGDVSDCLHYEGAKPFDPTPEDIGAVECLWNTFGGHVNSKGYKVLSPAVGLIYGDSITLPRAQAILQRLKEKGFASSNIVFGIGSFTYQFVTRDTFGFAVKSTYGEVNGVGREIYKDPKTDSGTKKSARGRLKVIRNVEGEFELRDGIDRFEYADDEMRTVFLDGELLVNDTLAAIRDRAKPGDKTNGSHSRWEREQG